MSILNLINCLVTVMSGCFKVIRWMLATVLVGILFLVIIAGIPVSALSRSTTQKETVKAWLKNSSLYDNFLDIGIDLMSENIDDDTGMLDLMSQIKDPESGIGKLVHDKFTPQFIEQNLNTILDGTYNWLEGNTEKPLFEIQIAEDEDELINMLTVGLQEQLRELPECADDYETPPNFSPIDTECLPSEYNPEDVSNYLTDNANTEEVQQLFESSQINTANMDIDKEVTRVARQIFLILNVMPFIFAGVVFVLSLFIILLVPGFQKGLTVTGFSLAIPAVIVYLGRIFASGTAVSTSISETSFSTINSSESTLSAETVEILSTVIESIFQTVYVDILEKTGLYCIILIATGAVLAIIGVSFGTKKSSKTYRPAPVVPEKKADTSTPAPQSAPKSTPQTPPAPQVMPLSPQENPVSTTPAATSQPETSAQPAAVQSESIVQSQPAVQPESIVQSQPAVQPEPVVQSQPAVQPVQPVSPPSNNNDLESIMPEQRPTTPTVPA